MVLDDDGIGYPAGGGSTDSSTGDSTSASAGAGVPAGAGSASGPASGSAGVSCPAGGCDTSWIEYAKTIQAIAQSGLAFTTNKYEIERYSQLRELSVDMMSRYAETPPPVVRELFAGESGYQTPKVDVRAAAFSEGKVLMVRETIDGLWSLPGGYADVGWSPKAVAAKEAYEESGYRVEPVKLIAVLDRQFHGHPLSPFHLYKIFFLCEIIGHENVSSIETSETGFFARDALPPLSTGRVTQAQMDMVFEFNADPSKAAVFD
ncbi:MAG: NUDIX hydrolase [Clostridiales bacterium]|nr:NUDIX hydrolase [Clostridiales bacterium]